MKRKLFCEISPLTYRISTKKEILMRKIRDLPLRGKFARVKQEELLPVRIKKHASLIRRRLGNVDMQLQENKAVNLSLAAPCIDPGADPSRGDLLLLDTGGRSLSPAWVPGRPW